MPASATLRDRLPSAAAAIALQGGLLALLVLSFEVVRHVAPEKETFITLPPLARPEAQRAPVVIDARPRASTVTPPAAENVTPRFTAPPDLALPPAPDNTLSPAPGRAVTACGAPGAGGQGACPPARAGSQSDEIPLHPESRVKNAPIWQSEIERRDTPPRVPCVSLTNNAIGLGGFQKEDHGARLDITCALKEWGNPSLLPPVRGAPADPGPQHASDDAFNKALQAVNARKQALSGRAPAAAAKAGAAP
jgi:hypothetical protein